METNLTTFIKSNIYKYDLINDIIKLLIYILNILRYELKSDSFVLRQIKAKTLWSQIIQSQIETGLPLLLFKDACNAKSNESHLGTIQCAGRNGDTVQFTSPDEVIL